jgi:hypothetical protein
MARILGRDGRARQLARRFDLKRLKRGDEGLCGCTEYPYIVPEKVFKHPANAKIIKLYKIKHKQVVL